MNVMKAMVFIVVMLCGGVVLAQGQYDRPHEAVWYAR